MIDFRLRNERILQEAADPEVAVILLDIVLGYGSNMDPASEIIPAINKAHTLAKNSGRHLVFIASVCGTESDPQNLHQQEYSLREAGVTLTESNAQAAFLAADVINNIKG
jgi:FdrA protein